MKKKILLSTAVSDSELIHFRSRYQPWEKTDAYPSLADSSNYVNEAKYELIADSSLHSWFECISLSVHAIVLKKEMKGNHEQQRDKRQRNLICVSNSNEGIGKPLYISIPLYI